jgi:phage terminase large subunit
VARKKTARRDSYRVQIALPDPKMAFSLERKRRLARRTRPVERTVLRVEPVGLRECQCITVDCPSGLYLGDGFVVTHNSYLLRSAAFYINLVLRDKGYPNRWGALFCNTYPNLRDRHLKMIEQEFQGLGRLVNSTKVGLHFKFYGEGLGGVYLRNLQADGQGGEARRGSEFDYILVDELTELTRDQFDRLLYTGRSASLPFVAFLGATNPDGVGHQWVKEIFVPQYRNLSDPFFSAGIDVSRDMLYVPARKTDNPAYARMSHVIDHRFGLISDPDVRKARDEGSWDLYASGRFGSVWDRERHVRTFEQFKDVYGIPAHLSLLEFLRKAQSFGFSVYTSLDYATSVDSVSAYLMHVVDPKGWPWTVRQMGMSGLQLEAQAERILEFEEGIDVEARYADPSIGGRAAEREDQRTRLERFHELGLPFLLAVNDRVEGWATVGSMLYFDKTKGTDPRWRILDECPDLIRELPNLPRDKANPEDVDKMGGRWHWSDAARYFLHTRFQGGSLPEPEAAEWSAKWFRDLAESSRRPKRSALELTLWR